MKYYWFDTNCFSDLINNKFSIEEKEKIFTTVENGEGRIVISPFTLYEILKGRNKLDEIRNLYDGLIALPSFYVANFLDTFKSNFGLFIGKNILNHMKMGEVLGDVPIEFAWYRDGYKKQLGVPYSHYMLQYSKIAAVLYLVCNECDKKGNISQRTENKIVSIETFDKMGNNLNNIEAMFSEFFIHYNYKSSEKDEDNALMQQQLLEFVNIMLDVAETHVQLAEENVLYDDAIFNQCLANNYNIVKISIESFHNVLDSVSKKTNNKYSPKKIYEKLIKNKLDSTFFAEVCEKFVSKRVFYKNINNDFIDALNIYCAGIFLKGQENFYYTDENFWIDYFGGEVKDKNLFDGNILYFKIRQN